MLACAWGCSGALLWAPGHLCFLPLLAFGLCHIHRLPSLSWRLGGGGIVDLGGAELAGAELGADLGAERGCFEPGCCELAGAERLLDRLAAAAATLSAAFVYVFSQL